MTSLHVGCGPNSKSADVGIDVLSGPAVDVVHDLNVFPWPLASSTFDYILCENVLEHLQDIVKVMEEIWRVSVSGAVIEIRVPSISSSDFFTDPTHVRAFGARSFDYFDPSRTLSQYGYSAATFQVQSVEYISHKGRAFGPLDGLVEKLANSRTELYENRLTFLFPMKSLRFRLRTTK